MGNDDIARRFAAAFAAGDHEALEGLLAEDTTLRLWTWEGDGAHRPKAYALDALAQATEGWLRDSLEVLTATGDGSSAAVQFRAQAREGHLPVDRNCGAFLGLEDGRISQIDLYLSQPIPAPVRFGKLRAAMPPAERDAIVQSLTNRWDMREFFPPNTRFHRTRRFSRYWTNVAHPGSNHVSRVQWSEAEADERIEETKQWFRERGLGVQWNVGPWDRPEDLGERLLRHGFIRSGDQALMLRFGLDDLDDIAVNPDIEVVETQTRPDLWEASLQVAATAFKWPPEQIENERDGWFEDLRSEPIRSYMALVDGKPVADSHLYLQSGVAYLGGAATLPEYRSRKIYSTLLRRRLERARDEGYEVAMIHSEPMSRRVVSRFGFETYAMFDVYGWMEPMDEEVVRSLVVDD